jgi:Lrp/AsnC family transcriptional regulator, leucine-responsive regulatory protein
LVNALPIPKPEIVEAHHRGQRLRAGEGQDRDHEQLQDVLRRIYAIEGVSGTQATVVLETFFERPLSPLDPDQSPAAR